MKKELFVVTDYDGCSYVEAGKLYRVIYTYDNGKMDVNNGKHDMPMYLCGPVGEACQHLGDVGVWRLAGEISNHHDVLYEAEAMLRHIKLLDVYAGEIIDDFLGEWIDRDEAEKRLNALGEK